MPTYILVLLLSSAVLVSVLFLVLGIVIKKGGRNSIRRVLITLIAIILTLAVGYICFSQGANPSTIFVFVALFGILGICVYYVYKNKNSDVASKKESSRVKNKIPHQLSNKRKTLAICFIVAIVAIGGAIAIILFDQDKKIELGYNGSASARQIIGQVERSKNKELTATDTHFCSDLKYIASQWDKNADWFDDSYCKKDTSIYADVTSTQKTVVLELFDGSHAAIYTFDPNIEYLLDYSFGPSTKEGYGIFVYELKNYLLK